MLPPILRTPKSQYPNPLRRMTYLLLSIRITCLSIGTAGSSLKSAQLAEEILSFAASRQLGNTEESARKAAFSEAWNSLSSEEKELVKHNFYEEEIEDLIDGAYNDYESVRGRFEDAGVGAEMEELSKDADAQKSWNALRVLMSGAE